MYVCYLSPYDYDKRIPDYSKFEMWIMPDLESVKFFVDQFLSSKVYLSFRLSRPEEERMSCFKRFGFNGDEF